MPASPTRQQPVRQGETNTTISDPTSYMSLVQTFSTNLSSYRIALSSSRQVNDFRFPNPSRQRSQFGGRYLPNGMIPFFRDLIDLITCRDCVALPAGQRRLAKQTYPPRLTGTDVCTVSPGTHGHKVIGYLVFCTTPKTCFQILREQIRPTSPDGVKHRIKDQVLTLMCFP